MLPFPFQKSTAFRILSFLLTVLIINLCGWQAAAAKIRLDNTFVPVVGTRTFGLSSTQVLPDGKVIVIRLSSQNILGDEEYKVTRLNADGSVDRIFDSVVLSRNDGKLVLQPDGKILVLYTNIIAGGQNRGGLVRLNADGMLDASFNPGWILYAGGAAIQPDGKIIVGALFYDSTQGTNRGGTFRLNTDGSLDQSFTPYINSMSYTSPAVFALQPDGKILLGYGQYASTGRIERLNADGTRDTAFNNNLPNSSGAGSLYATTGIVIQSDGKIIIGGSGVIRLNRDGTPDFAYPAYAAYGGYTVYGLIRQPDDKVIIGGTGWYNTNTPMRKRLTRINADGTQDNTFDAMTGENFGYDGLIPLALRPDGRILVSNGFTNFNVTREGFSSLNPNGTLDQTFSPDLGFTSGRVTHLKAQPDGKILIAGFFARVNNFPTFGFARLNPDGTTDTGFSFSDQITHTTQGVNYLMVAIALQADGKILIGGNFRFNNQEKYGVFRLNQNGSLDSSFTPHTFTYPGNYPYASVNALAVQADGKILVGGVFQNYGNSGRNNLVRLNTDGSVDTTYTATSTRIDKMLVQPGGKIVVSGTITENGNTRTNPRLNTDGSFDPTFNMPTDVGSVYAVAPDGRLATSGSFPFGNTSATYVFRLNADGSRDLSFVPQRFFDNIYDIAFQNDGRIIVAKAASLTRFDGSDRVQTLIQNVYDIRALLVTTDNKLIIGGGFREAAAARRTGIARFLLTVGDFDFDGDGKSDISLFRPSVGEWYVLRSSDGASFGTNFGLQNDLIAPADFDGDGRTDIAVFRPTDGGWYRLSSLNNTFSALQFGANGDLPVPGDFDGDGKADIAVYRPSDRSWYRLNSSNNQFVGAQFGATEDKPVVGDFDGDGKSDLTVYRPSEGSWYRINSSNNQFVGAQFGTEEDKPVAADYDGDGKTDLAVYRPSNGYWYHINSGNAYTFIATQFGTAEDKPTPADFDGDEKADFAVFRPSNGTWYLLRSSQGFTGVQYGANGDAPTPNAFVR